MAVQPKSLELLDRAKIPSEQAHAIVGAMDIEFEAVRDTLATKHDVSLLRKDMEAMRKDMDSLRAELRKDMDGLRTELRKEIASARESLEGKMQIMRNELMTEIYKFSTRSMRQMLAQTLLIVSMLIGIALYLVGHGAR